MGKMQTCPLSTNRPQLCNAALSSLMIDKRFCLCQAYDRCPIYSIESHQGTDLYEFRHLSKRGKTAPAFSYSVKANTAKCS